MDLWKSLTPMLYFKKKKEKTSRLTERMLHLHLLKGSLGDTVALLYK